MSVQTRLPRMARRAVTLAALIALTLTGGHVAFAADEDEATTRWSVEPADAEGADGRTAINHELDPGESVEDHIVVQNLSPHEVEFQLTAADGFFSRTGRFDILPAGEESVGSGTWIDVPEAVRIGPLESAVIPVSITVPENAEPGDHAAGITASVLSTQSAEDGTSVGVESRVGVRVTTRVTGEITPSATVTSLDGHYAVAWNPFRPGDLTVTFEVVNDGNTRLLAEGQVAAGGARSDFPGPGGSRQELLPGDARSLSVVVRDVWPTFFAPAQVSLVPTMVTMDGNTSQLGPVVGEVWVWAVPWPQLILLIGLLLLIAAVAWGRLRSRRRIASMLAEAREAGRRDATQVPRSGDSSESERGLP